ncbi:hypothetical protein HPB47_019490 [Ixodes persulcatus]|uniref:Uncharacterized protein n=1 Tax=Ixodes persulcatus TaxID=34615 RepID=A0AC60QIX7_IXOPE|nr:hypothetical protein HPB47_019490 [Ixodes persulcatus]
MTVEQQVLCVLRFYATGSYQGQVASDRHQPNAAPEFMVGPIVGAASLASLSYVHPNSRSVGLTPDCFAAVLLSAGVVLGSRPITSFQSALGCRHLAVHQTTVSACVRAVATAIVRRLGPRWIAFPKTAEERAATQEAFLRRGSLPGVVGCVDGTFVAIKGSSKYDPTVTKALYWCRKLYYALNVMVCGLPQINEERRSGAIASRRRRTTPNRPIGRSRRRTSDEGRPRGPAPRRRPYHLRKAAHHHVKAIDQATYHKYWIVDSDGDFASTS